jgi:UDP-N-acetylmuramate--alanine ligase
LGEVFAAGEAPIAGADGRALSRAIRARGQVDPVFIENIEDLPEILKDLVADRDIVVTMGAGNIGAVAANMAEALCP